MNAALLVAVALAQLHATSDLVLEQGLAQARAGRFENARDLFESGAARFPADKRFLVELAGVEFRLGRRAGARGRLRRALKLDPADAYARDFLATLWLLDGNVEAALEHWNRIGKPRVEEVRVEPEPSLDAVLLDRAFAFAPASQATLEQLYETEARLRALHVFRSFRFDLAARPERDFDLVLRQSERRGTRAGVFALLRGAPFQTVYPEFFNIGGRAVNFESLVRWDARKRRVRAALSAPLRRDPRWGVRLFGDGRREDWRLAAGPDFRLDRVEAGAGIEGVPDGNWGWSSGVRVARRRFRSAPEEAVFRDGVSVKYVGRADRVLLRLPERRVKVESTATGEFGRLFGAGRYGRLHGAAAAHWLSHSGAYAMNSAIRAGRVFGAVPFDELFILGLERDNDLALRAHIGTENGRKGSAPIGRGYGLWNWDADRRIFRAPLLELRAGPFLDAGRMAGRYGDRRWLWDAGVLVRLRLLNSVEVVFSFGKDLRTGRSAWYATTDR